jgi:hypothetical protein
MKFFCFLKVRPFLKFLGFWMKKKDVAFHDFSRIHLKWSKLSFLDEKIQPDRLL